MRTIIEPDLLQTFVAIAESGSFTDAARRVHRTQGAVSMQMKRLEETLGRAVFARNGRSVHLTTDGELLLGHARRILRSHQEALAAFDDSKLEGTVRFGSDDIYAANVLPQVLARFSQSHCCVHIEMHCDDTDRLLERLAADELDLVLVSASQNSDGELVMQEPLVWAASVHHCAHERDPLPLALFQEGCAFRAAAFEALTRQGRRFWVAYSSQSFSGIDAALRAGLAVSALPRFSLGEGLRILGEAEGFPALPDYAVSLLRAPGEASPLVESLGEHITASFRSLKGLAAAA